MNYREILEDFVNNETTEYCYDWQSFDYETILPCIEQLLKNENNLQSKIDKVIEYIEKDTRWFDSEYASVYGELCDCKGYNANRLEVMVNPSNLLKILKEDK